MKLIRTINRKQEPQELELQELERPEEHNNKQEPPVAQLGEGSEQILVKLDNNNHLILHLY